MAAPCHAGGWWRTGANVPANGGAATGGEVTKMKRGVRGCRCTHPNDEERTETAGGEEEAAERFDEVAARRSGGAPAKWRRAPGARGCGDADGTGGEDAKTVTAALEAVE